MQEVICLSASNFLLRVILLSRGQWNVLPWDRRPATPEGGVSKGVDTLALHLYVIRTELNSPE